MLLCSGRPVSFNCTRILRNRCLQSALAQTYMLHSISRPVSSSRILTGLDHLHQGALVQTLLQNTSRPASLCPTDTLQIVYLQTLILLSLDITQPANYPPIDLQHTDLAPTDQVPLLSLALIHHLYRLIDKIVSPVWNLNRTVNYQTDLQLNFLWRKESFQRIKSSVNLSNRL